MTIDPNERELRAQFLGLAAVCLDVYRALEEERFVRAVPMDPIIALRHEMLRYPAWSTTSGLP
jgi:hypothetical protein